MPKDNEEASTQHPRYRRCFDCGAVHEVTFLIPRRRYACGNCGFPFMHHPALVMNEKPEPKRGNLLLRLLPALIFAALIPVMVKFAFELEIPDLRFFSVIGAQVFLTFIGALWIRRISRDPAGLMAVALTMAAFALVVLSMFAKQLEDLDAATRLQSRVTFAAVVMLAIGAFSLNRFMRNRSTLVRVGEGGRIAGSGKPNPEEEEDILDPAKGL